MEAQTTAGMLSLLVEGGAPVALAVAVFFIFKSSLARWRMANVPRLPARQPARLPARLPAPARRRRRRAPPLPLTDFVAFLNGEPVAEPRMAQKRAPQPEAARAPQPEAARAPQPEAARAVLVFKRVRWNPNVLLESLSVTSMTLLLKKRPAERRKHT